MNFNSSNNLHLKIEGEAITINENFSSSNIIEGVLFIGREGDGEKTDPKNISEWLSEEFIKMHNVYAIKEEESFLLKIYTRDREVANKVIRKKGGRKPMLMGQEVHGEIIVACGRCGYRSTEGSNVRRHLRKSVCAKERGYSKKELDGLNRLERQKFIRRVAAAKFRAKKKLKVDGLPETDSISEVRKSRQKEKKKTRVSRALLLGPYVEKETVQRVSFDVFTLSEHNVKFAWKPPSCHKATGESCQIVFKGARMKRRCLDLPLPIILTYRKLDCKVHHCNFTLFHPHARKAFKEDSAAKMSVDIRVYEDTVITQEFYHHFVSLISVMKMKASQCARYLTSVWEIIIMERLKSSSVPEEYRKLLTLSKQTVKSMWNSIEEESGRKNSSLQSKIRKRKCSQNPSPSPTSPVRNGIAHSNSELSYPSSSAQALHQSLPDMHTQHQVQTIPQQPQQQQQPLQQQPPQQQQHILHHLPSQQQQHHHQDFSHADCMKRYPPASHLPPPPPPLSHPIQKLPHQGVPHPLPLHHSHSLLQAPSHHPQWVGPIGQAHSMQYPSNMSYTVSSHHDDYYSVQASFVSQYTPVTIGTSP